MLMTQTAESFLLLILQKPQEFATQKCLRCMIRHKMQLYRLVDNGIQNFMHLKQESTKLIHRHTL
jgi:hypothetical protein